MDLYGDLWDLPDAGVPSAPPPPPLQGSVDVYDNDVGHDVEATSYFPPPDFNRLSALTDGMGNAPPVGFLTPQPGQGITTDLDADDDEDEDEDMDAQSEEEHEEQQSMSVSSTTHGVVCDDFHYYPRVSSVEGSRNIGYTPARNGATPNDNSYNNNNNNTVLTQEEHAILRQILNDTTPQAEDEEDQEDEEDDGLPAPSTSLSVLASPYDDQVPTRPSTPIIQSPYFSQQPSKRKRVSRAGSATSSSRATTPPPDSPDIHREEKRRRLNNNNEQTSVPMGAEDISDCIPSPVYNADQCGPVSQRQQQQNGESCDMTTATPTATATPYAAYGNNGGEGRVGDAYLFSMSQIRPGEECHPEMDDSAPIWCFGCRWGAPGHKPVDNAKVREFVREFVELIMDGSTSLTNIAGIVSDNYNSIIREPALRVGQYLPQWPPDVVLNHINNMTEPRIVTSLLIRKQKDMVYKLHQYAFTGNQPNLATIRVLNQSLQRLQDLYRPVTKDAFGYNENMTANTWKGSVFVHPARVESTTGSRFRNNPAAVSSSRRIRQQNQYHQDGQGGTNIDVSGAFSGAPIAASADQAGVRQPAVSLGGQDTGGLRGPANDEELIR